MFPATSTTDPNSPTARAKLMAAPERMAGTRFGSTTRRKMAVDEAPSDAAASSISRSSSWTTGCTERTTKGSVTKASASRMAHVVATAWMPTGDVGPTSASRMIPTTIVGRAKGRSMTALMAALPRNRSRTSTHAVAVPATALTAATASDVHSDSFSADTAWRLVTADQKVSRPPSVERATSAASGMRTMTLSHSVATPSPSALAPPVVTRGTRRAARAVTASLGSGDPRILLDGGDRALVGIEERVVDLAPPAEVADGEQAAGGRELGLVLVEHRLVDRAVAPVGELLLGGGRERVVEERLGLLGVLGLRDDGDRVLDQDRLVRDDVVDLLALLLGRDGLVLVGDEDVPVARREVLQRLAARLVLDLDVLGDELAQVREALLRVLAAAALGPVGGQDVPLRGTRRERVRGEDLDARLEQVVPGVDALRVALAHDERDDRLGHEALVSVGGPVVGHEPGLDQARHVRLEGEGHDVSGQAGLDGTTLIARGAEGLREADALAGGGGAKARDDLVVDDLRGGVGDERELRRALARRRGGCACASCGVVGAAAAGCREGNEREDGDERTGLHGNLRSKNRHKPCRVWAD